MIRAALVLLIWPAALIAEPDWVGKWSVDSSFCDNNADNTYDYNQLPMLITEEGMQSNPETYCEIVTTEGIAGFEVTAVNVDCHSGGEIYPGQRVLLQSDIDILHIWFGGENPVRFDRCLVSE